MDEIQDPVIEALQNEQYIIKSDKENTASSKTNNSKNRAKFSQLILENILYICNVHPEYLNNAEFALLFKLSSLTCKDYNYIVEYEKRTSGGYKTNSQHASISNIARFLNLSRSNVSKNIGSLIEKGIVFEDIDEIIMDKNNSKSNSVPLFLNPEICFRGDRSKILGELSRKVIEADILEQNDIKLPWKLWVKSNAKSGMLIRRSTYVRKKRQYKGK